MPIGAYETFTQGELTPSMFPERMLKASFPVAAGAHILKGQLVGVYTGANTPDVQTLTGAAAVGTFTISFGVGVTYTTTALSGTATAAQVQAALQALPNIGAGGVTCTGGALGTNPVVCTFAGTLANQPQPAFVVNSGGLASGTMTNVHTTTGIANGAIGPYAATLVANPTTVPTLSDNAGAGTWSTATSSTFEVAYTYVTPAGETIPSYAATIALATASHSIGIASITGIPAGVTFVNVYVNGFFAKQVAVANNATGAIVVSGPAAATAATPPPYTSTAYLANDGSQIPVGISVLEVYADPSGNVTYGLLPTTNNQGSVKHVAPVAITGYFSCADLTGLDTNAVSKLGRLITGSTTSGVFCMVGP